MKKNAIPTFLSVILVIALMATPVFAKDNQNEGKPFQEIWEAITELQEWAGNFLETDPVFVGSPAAGISSGDISNWDAAYGWGDHSAAGYLTSVPSQYMEEGENVSLLNNDAGYLTGYTETDPVFNAMDSESELEAKVGTNVYTTTDGTLADDDLSNNNLTDLSNVNISGVTDGQLLAYDTTSGKWINVTIATAMPKLGAWETKNANQTYRAATDGFVVAWGAGTSGDSFISGRTGSTSPPTQVVGEGAKPYLGMSITMPVRQGDYWEVGTNASIKEVRWISFGN